MSPKTFQCSECKEGMTAFDTEEALLTHKWNMIKSTKRKSHMRCHVCKLEHRTFEGLVRHYQISHPAKQKLNCPGCNKLFARLHQLMGHLEADDCPVIMAERVRQNRMLQVHTTNMLAAATDPYSGPMQRIEGIGTAAFIEDSPHTVRGMQSIQDPARHMETLQERMNDLNVMGAADDDDNGTASKRPNFSYSGVTMGDFGAFINIKPKVAEAMAVAVAAQNEAQAQLVAGQQLLLQDGASAASSRLPTTSTEAIEEMIRRQRENGRGSSASTVKGKAKATVHDMENAGGHDTGHAASGMPERDATIKKQSTRDYRQGDSKGPDLLTDDTSPVAQRNKNKVWAGQEPMGMHESESSRAPSRAGAPAHGATASVVRAGNTVPSAPGSVAGHAGHAAGASSTKAVPTDPNHPHHPRFNVNNYRDEYSGRYSCPHELCQHSGKQYKSSSGLISHLLSDTAHSTRRHQCPSCFGWFTSLNALMQHIESPTTRCHFRETDEYVPFVNILSAGVVDVQGHNADMTLAYSVQPTAAATLLEDGMLRAQAADDDDEDTVW